MERKHLFCSTNTFDISITRTPSLVDDFYCEKIGTNSDSKPTVRFIDPIYMLFNQQRLERMGSDNVQKWLDSLNAAGNKDIQELRQKCTDEQLQSMIKSRYLQSPSEILSWCRYINENVEEFNSEMQRLVQQQTASVDTSQVTNSNTE